MKIILNNFHQTTVDPSTVSVNSSASDPIPTCSLALRDNDSTLQVLGMQELLILDDKVIPNPTINELLNPTLDPYTTSWDTETIPSGVTLSQNSGGGLTITFNNCSTSVGTSQGAIKRNFIIVAGQTYCFSATLTGSSPVNIRGAFIVVFYDANFVQIGSINRSGFFTPTGTPTVCSYAQTAPAGASYVTAILSFAVTSSTNSGSLTWTKVQFEPQWFSTQSYPSPFCGPSETNCRQLPNGRYIRQYRKFAGFVTSKRHCDYHGNSRTVQVSASGYAVLLGLVYSNKTYTSQNDSAIIADLLNTYLTSQLPLAPSAFNMVSTTNVQTGVQWGSLVLPWDDLRTIFNNMASQIGWYWSIDYYWSYAYAPPGYNTMPISLICDNSSTPDMTTTFPAYDFSAEMDYTQPGSNILVLGKDTNTAQVIDPAQINALGFRCGYFLPTTSSWMRKVNESSINSTNDCVQRGIAELTQYDYERYVYHLTANVELIAGQAIAITASTEGLNKAMLLIQQVGATWLGVDELLEDVWEYKATLGAINRHVPNILSRLARESNSNSSAVAIATTALAVFERLGLVDTPSQLASGTTLQYDSGARSSAVSSGWQYATDGMKWTVTDTANAKTTTALLQFYNNAESFGRIGASNDLDCTVTARISIANSAFVPGVMLRYTDTSNFIKLDFSGGSLRLRKRIAGANSNVATASVTMNTGTAYWFKLQVSGTTYNGKFWEYGTTEPSSWTVTGSATDSALSSGLWGLYGSPTTSSTIDFDNFTVTA